MEPFLGEVLPVLHRRHDHGEGLELESLLAEDGVGSKERDDLHRKIVAVPYHIDGGTRVRVASRTVWTGSVGSRRGSFLPRRRIPLGSRPAFAADCPA